MHSGESEHWKPIHFGFGYEVSNLGRVRSEVSGLVLRSKPRINGYISAALKGADGQKRFYVHRLVAAAFIRPINQGEVVNHINFIRSDNRACNLEIVTPAQNAAHSVAAGRYADNGRNVPRGDLSPGSKVRSGDVLTIRERHASGESLGALGRQFGITKNQVSNIVNRRSWAHL